MKSATGLPFTRRHLLRAAGATLLVPRFLRTAFAAEESLPPRMVIYLQANGTHQATFWPDAGFRSPALAPLLDDPLLAPYTTVVRGVSLDIPNELRLGNGHDQGSCSLFTGLPQLGTQSVSWGAGRSVDQTLKSALAARLAAVPYPTLNCGVHACVVAPKTGNRVSFSYAGRRQQVPTEIDPLKLWTALFTARAVGESAADAEARAAARLRQRRSVLDAVSRDLKSLSARVGAEERRKLDLHETGLRELETRLGTRLVAPAPGARCTPLSQQGGATSGTAIDPTLEENVPVLMELMLDLVAQSLACNVVRIVTFGAGFSGNLWRYRWLDPPLDRDSHQDIAHGDGGGDGERGDWMTKMTAWHAENFAALARKCRETPDVAGRNVLDDALLVFGNENATGQHGTDDLPFVFVGRSGGRLTRGGRLVDTATRTTTADGKPQVAWASHHQLNTTLLRLMGAQARGFGDRPECGPLPGFGLA